MSRFASLLMCIAFALALTACDQPRSQDEINNQYYQSGYAKGVQDGQAQGHDEGYREGFAAAYPTKNRSFTEFTTGAINVLTFLGIAKVIISIIVVCIVFISRNANPYHVGGKLVMGIIGTLIGLFGTPSLGTSNLLSDLLLTAAPNAAWLVSVAAALIAYFVASVGEKVVKAINGPKVEGLTILVLAAVAAILIRSAVALFLSQQVENYLGSYLFMGILVGGLFYLAMWLLSQRHTADV